MLKDVAKAPGRILARHSEHANRVPQGARAGKRLQPARRHKIDPSAQQIRQVKPDLRECYDADLRLELDHDVDVAVRPILAARGRTEHGRVRDSAPPEILGVAAQRGDDRIESRHAPELTRRHVECQPADRPRLLRRGPAPQSE